MYECIFLYICNGKLRFKHNITMLLFKYMSNYRFKQYELEIHVMREVISPLYD